jgi:hypothetical protein
VIPAESPLERHTAGELGITQPYITGSASRTLAATRIHRAGSRRTGQRLPLLPGFRPPAAARSQLARQVCLPGVVGTGHPADVLHGARLQAGSRGGSLARSSSANRLTVGQVLEVSGGDGHCAVPE